MEDGKVVITGSNWGSEGNPNEPGPQVAIYSPATNTWAKMIPEYELNESRYYPSVYRLTDGRIATFGGQAQKSPALFVPEPYEINPNKTTLLAAWDQPVEDDWDFQNYPHLFPISASELFFAGPARHNGGGSNGGRNNYRTFYFDLASPEPQAVPLGGFSELWHSPSVMYRPGKILKAGGVEALDATHGYHTTEATQNAEAIHVTLSGESNWAYVAPMHRKRP